MDKSTFHALADRQPAGTAVSVLPSPTSPTRRVYVTIARLLRANGQNINFFAP